MAWEDPISEPQVNLIKKFINQDRQFDKLPQAQREFLFPGTEEELDANLSLMNRRQADAAIKVLKDLPWKPQQITEVPVETTGGGQIILEVPVDETQPDEVAPVQGLGTKAPQAEMPPEGYFFIIDPTEPDPDKVEKFFRVRHGRKDTRWEGYAFLDVQASDFFYPVRDPRRRAEIFKVILKDPVSAMNEYGMRLGRCGVCNRTLTDRHSILRGIGPICAERLGPTTEQESMLRRLGLIKD